MNTESSHKSAVVLIGHGSRRAAANADFERYVAAYRARRPDLDVSHAFLEQAEPVPGEALRAAAGRAQRVVALPFLLFRSAHAASDLPRAVTPLRREFPEVRFEIGAVLGAHRRLAELAYERARETELLIDEAPEKIAIVYIAHGSNDPDANEAFFEQARLFEAGRGHRVAPCFWKSARPGLAETLDSVARDRPERVVVVPHFLLAGVLTDRIKDEVASFARGQARIRIAVAPPLGVHPYVLDVVDERVEQALAARSGRERPPAGDLR